MRKKTSTAPPSKTLLEAAADEAEKLLGRKATKPLYVMVEADEKARYERVAAEMNMSMRDLVRMALDNLIAERTAAKQGLIALAEQDRGPRAAEMNTTTYAARDARQAGSPRADVDAPWMMKTVMEQSTRISRLEELVEALWFVVRKLESSERR